MILHIKLNAIIAHLRNRYSQLTFQTLIRAVLRIAALNFDIVECIGRRYGIGGSVVMETSLTEKGPINNQVVPIHNLRVIVAQGSK